MGAVMFHQHGEGRIDGDSLCVPSNVSGPCRSNRPENMLDSVFWASVLELWNLADRHFSMRYLDRCSGQ